jgi:outer membrane protein
MRKIFFLCFILLFVPLIAQGAVDKNGAKNSVPTAAQRVPPPRPIPADAEHPLTLTECYKLALKQSEIIAIDAQRIKEAEAHFLQAFGTLMPQVSLGRADQRQQSEKYPAMNKGFNQSFMIRQQLFTGFKEIARMSAARYEKKARVDEKYRAEQLLFVDVADAFYLLLELREDLETLDIIKKALFERIAELKEREALGKSRASEVIMTQVQLYNLEAEIVLVEAQGRVACELLSFLIGGPAEYILETELDIALKPEERYVAEAPGRKDVLATYNAWQADLKRVIVAKSGFMPKLNFEADLYTHRYSNPADAHWQTFLTVDIPIFTGTIVYGDVVQAKAIARSSELYYQRLKRVAVREIHDAYTAVEASLRRTKILENAQKAAEENYRLQTEDYKLNCVNNLDVLSSIQTLNNTRRDYIHADYQSKRFYWQLRYAAGEIDVGE